MQSPIQRQWEVPCRHCYASLPSNPGIDLSYFEGIRHPCGKCGKPIDWWESTLHIVKDAFSLGQILSPVGAQATFFTERLIPNQILKIDVGKHQIPIASKLLEINYTCEAGGGLHPLEIHGNVPVRHNIPRHISLYPMPFSIDGGKPGPTRINIMVTWVHRNSANQAWQSIVDAFEAFTLNRLEGCVVPANVAVELTLAVFLTKYLSESSSQKRVEEFLRDNATYSHQLNILLPKAAEHLGMPPLPESIRGLLNRLRDLRNDIAHRGKPRASLKKNEAAELVVAALFGFHYLRLVGRSVYGTQLRI